MARGVRKSMGATGGAAPLQPKDGVPSNVGGNTWAAPGGGLGKLPSAASPKASAMLDAPPAARRVSPRVVLGAFAAALLIAAPAMRHTALITERDADQIPPSEGEPWWMGYVSTAQGWLGALGSMHEPVTTLPANIARAVLPAPPVIISSDINDGYYKAVPGTGGGNVKLLSVEDWSMEATFVPEPKTYNEGEIFKQWSASLRPPRTKTGAGVGRGEP